MHRLAAILQAILTTLITTFTTVPRWVGGRLVQVAEASYHVVSAAGAAVGTMADVALLPLRAISAVLDRIWRRPQAPQSAADQAARRTAQDQASAEAASERVVRAHAVRRVASAVQRGARPPEDAVQLLSPAVVSYLRKLSPKEAEILVRASNAGLQHLVDTGTAPKGVRGPNEVRDEAEKPVEGRKPAASRLRDRALVDALLAEPPAAPLPRRLA